MPLAYGSLLGGLTTLIGTPPNLLIAGALDDAGLESFSMFDFAPVGIGVLIAGVLFMAFVARFLLPEKAPGLTLFGFARASRHASEKSCHAFALANNPLSTHTSPP